MNESTMTETQKLEMEIYELSNKLLKVRKDNPGEEIKNYNFTTLTGTVDLKSLFKGRDTLFMIMNMGQGCRYCTLWADGINAFLPHLENQYAVALASKDDPQTQQRFANERGWRFTMVSHGGGDFMTEQSVGEGNYPGIICFQLKGDKIIKKNYSAFGPGDQFCSLWSIITLAGHTEGDFTPQYNYWKRPEKLDDGGKNVQ